MRKIVGTTLASALVVAFAACSSNGGNAGASLDCAWLASDNCWKTTAAAAGSCLPDSSSVGTLSADGKTCTFSSGQTIAFDTPLVLPLPSQGATFNFTMTGANGQPCLAFKQPDSHTYQLTTSAGTVTGGAYGIATETITCPNGVAFSNSDALSLLSCDAGFFGGLPGDTYDWTDTSATFGLVGTAGDGSVQVFVCQLGT